MSASAQGAATQALQRRHSGALSRAKSAMCCCGGWLAVRRPGPGARSWGLGAPACPRAATQPIPAPPAGPGTLQVAEHPPERRRRAKEPIIGPCKRVKERTDSKEYGALFHENQSLIGLLQYLVNKKVLQHKVVVLWRAPTVWYKDYAPPPMWQQVWLELWYGKKLLQDHLVVINSAAFGLWDGPPRKPKKQRPLTHEQFLADEARYKEVQRKYEQSERGTETRRK